MAQRFIVIKHEELHPKIRAGIKDILDARSERSFQFGRGFIDTPALVMMTGASMVGLPGLAFGSPDLAKGGAGGFLVSGLFGGAVGTAGYKGETKEVRERTLTLGKTISTVEALDSEGRHKIAKLRRSHPFAYVTKQGHLVLVPKTNFQRALAIAQKTFLKGLIPGRLRVEI